MFELTPWPNFTFGQPQVRLEFQRDLIKTNYQHFLIGQIMTIDMTC